MKISSNTILAPRLKGQSPTWRVASCVFLVFLCLGSCATMIPEPKDTEATLMLISVDTQIPSGIEVGISSYEIIKIKDVDKTITLKPGKPFVIVTDLPPGSYITEHLRQKVVVKGDWKSDVVGLQPPQEFIVPFKMKSGFLTIFPVKFTFIVDQTRGHTYSYGWKLEKMTEADQRSLLNRLKDQDNFSSWKNDLNIK